MMFICDLNSKKLCRPFFQRHLVLCPFFNHFIASLNVGTQEKQKRYKEKESKIKKNDLLSHKLQHLSLLTTS